jgi:4-hydroxy-2-oxoheptanedioate aldolase
MKHALVPALGRLTLVGPVAAGIALVLVFAWPKAPAAQGPPPDRPRFVRGLPVPGDSAPPPKGTLKPVSLDPGRPWGWMVKAVMEHPQEKLYNRAKQRLLDGKQLTGHVIKTFDPATYCLQAPHYDYTWFDMQHGLVTFAEIQKMLDACPRAGAAPMIRLANLLAGDIQTAMDIGVLGLAVPDIDDALKARQAAMYVRFPPVAHRGSGNTASGFAALLWNPLAPPGSNFRRSINDNMLIVAMIESQDGVDHALEIATTPGIDVLFMGNNDLQEDTGIPMSDGRYQDMLTTVRNAAYLAGKFWGNVLQTNNPLWPDSRFNEFGPPFDGWVDPVPGPR